MHFMALPSMCGGTVASSTNQISPMEVPGKAKLTSATGMCTF